jgi:hypothetical protein
MVLFPSDYPNEQNERDGMMQRIAAVDSIFSSAPRLYLFVSFTRHRRTVAYSQGQVRVERVNFFLHYRYVTRCFEAATCVYLHSALNAMRVLPWIRRFKHKIVADAHGLIPEELAFVGRFRRATIWGAVERAMVKNSRLLVVVTQKMADHFLSKYPREIETAQVVILPNFDFQNGNVLEASLADRSGHQLRLIYAGGVQKWQNIDFMLVTLRRLADIRRDWRSSLYVPPEAVHEIQGKVEHLGCDSFVSVGSLAHDEVLRQYATADLGFVLREPTLMNEVAMPTKLVEYIRYGVVPIVLSPKMGDFMQLGYRYLTIEDLLDLQTLDRRRLKEIRLSNLQCLASIRALALASADRLEACCQSL